MGQLRLRAITWLPGVAQLDAAEVMLKPRSPDPSVVESVTMKAELSPWNVTLSPAVPPSPGFVWLIPSLGERGMFT